MMEILETATTLCMTVTIPSSGWFVIHVQEIAMVNRPTKFSVHISTGYKDIKATQNVDNGVVWSI